MANSETIKTTIDANINTNGNQAITGAVLNRVLNDMVDEYDSKLAQLDQELKALKARVAALEGNEEPEDPSEPDIPVANYTLSATAFNGKVVATMNGESVSLPYVAREGDVISLEVVADNDYEFVKWSDGNADNPRVITIDNDINIYASCGLIAESAEDYELLRGIYSVTGQSYINSQEPFDSSSRWDLYFGIYGSASGGQLLPLIGIRRTSGTGDSAANGFYYNRSSTWSPYAWVVGGTDAGAIGASGYGVPFKGNMHKLSQRGNDIYEWDRQIGHTDKTFTNPDNVPAFIGSLSKTATATYNTLESRMIFYRFVALDENDHITKDLRPAKRIADGVLGAYNVIDKTFTAAKGTWQEYEDADSASIRIMTQVAKGTPAPSGTLQGANLYHGYWVSVHDTQRQFAIVKDAVYNDGTIHYPAQQVLTCSESNSAWHGNASWLSDKKWDDNDFFPLLYVSTDKSNELLCVYRIIGSNPDALEGIELVQKIHTPRTTPWYFNNYYGMAGANTFIHVGYIQNTWSDATDNTIMARVLPLPDAKIGDVTIAESEALTGDINIGFGVAIGDGYWTGKYFGATFSSPTPGEGKYKIYEIGVDSLELEPVFAWNSLHDQSSNEWLTNSELEGIKYSPFDNKWSLCIEPTDSGRLNYIEYAPLSNYIEIKTW